MRQKTLLVMDSSVMSLQLLHSDIFPLFWRLMIVPILQALISFNCPRRPGVCVEEAVAFPVLMFSASLHTHCRPLVLYRSPAS